MTPAADAMRLALFGSLDRTPTLTQHETSAFWDEVAERGLEAARAGYRTHLSPELQKRMAADAMCGRFWDGHPHRGRGGRWDEAQHQELELNWWPAADALLATARASKAAA